MEKQGMNRRDFLLLTGTAVIAMPLVAALGGCGGDGAAPVAPAGDFTVISTASTANNHTHAITIKAAELAAAVQMTYTASLDSGHTHTVTITAADFSAINAGTTITKTTSVDLTAHTHDFIIKKP